MLQNLIGGLQGVIDQAMVGHYVGFAGNAAIGVSWQIFLVLIVFVSSLFTGMNVLVARFAGAGDVERVNRTVYQAFLTAMALSLGVLAPLGYVLSPSLLGLVNAAPEVRAEALPFLRILFVYSGGMLVFFMLGGALRSAGDARTPLRLGAAVTALNVVLNFVLIRGLGPDPRVRYGGRCHGDGDRRWARWVSSRWWHWHAGGGPSVSGRGQPAAGLGHHPRAVSLRPASRDAGDRDERGRRAAAVLHRLAAAQRRGTGGLCRRVP